MILFLAVARLREHPTLFFIVRKSQHVQNLDGWTLVYSNWRFKNWALIQCPHLKIRAEQRVTCSKRKTRLKSKQECKGITWSSLFLSPLLGTRRSSILMGLAVFDVRISMFVSQRRSVTSFEGQMYNNNCESSTNYRTQLIHRRQQSGASLLLPRVRLVSNYCPSALLNTHTNWEWSPRMGSCDSYSITILSSYFIIFRLISISDQVWFVQYRYVMEILLVTSGTSLQQRGRSLRRIIYHLS